MQCFKHTAMLFKSSRRKQKAKALPEPHVTVLGFLRQQQSLCLIVVFWSSYEHSRKHTPQMKACGALPAQIRLIIHGLLIIYELNGSVKNCALYSLLITWRAR